MWPPQFQTHRHQAECTVIWASAVLSQRSHGWWGPAPSAGGRSQWHSRGRSLELMSNKSHYPLFPLHGEMAEVPANNLLLDPHCIATTTRQRTWVIITWPSPRVTVIIWRINPNFSDMQCSFSLSISQPVWSSLSQAGHSLASPNTPHTLPPLLSPLGRLRDLFLLLCYRKFIFYHPSGPHSRLLFAETSLAIPSPWWYLDQFGLWSIVQT